MNRPSSPPLPRPTWWVPMWIGLGGLGAMVAVRLATAWAWPLPFCLLRKLTGVPCPACGSTRSLLAWTHFDLVGAFRFNPLFALAFVLGLAWLFLWASDRWLGRRWAETIRSRGQKLPWRWIVAVLATLNWVYLCFGLPK